MKTNLKSFIALCSALLMMASATACGGSSEEKVLLEDPVISEQTEQSEQNEWSDPSLSAPDASEPTEAEEPKEAYESDVLALYYEQYLLKDVFERAPFRTNPYTLLTADNGVYSVSNSTENQLEGVKDVKNVFTIGGKVAYEGANGVCTILALNRRYADVIGTPVYAFASNPGWSDELQIVSMDDEGSLYFTTFDSSDSKTRFDNAPVELRDPIHKTTYTRVDSFEVVEVGGIAFGYAVVGETHLYNTFSAVPRIGDEVYIEMIALEEPVDKVFDWGYMSRYTNYFEWTSPLFSKKGDEDNLYYKRTNSELFTVELPEGRKVSELTRVLFANRVLMVFADGTVYAGDRGDQLTELPELSAYAAEGKIKDYYFNNYGNDVTPTLVILMDDNVMYKYVSE